MKSSRVKNVEHVARMVEMILIQNSNRPNRRKQAFRRPSSRRKNNILHLTVSGCNMWGEFIWLSNSFHRWFILNQQWNLITVFENMRKRLSLVEDGAAQGHLTYTVRKISKRILHSTQRIY